MRTNTPHLRTYPKTHEGARARIISPEAALRRSVMACLLWENQFYEDGESIANRISALVAQVPAVIVERLAMEARGPMNLRHVPLLLCRELARNRRLKAGTLAGVIQRADELAEFLSLYFDGKRRPLAGQVKKGLARAFTKFDAYALAKYNRDGAVKLRDALFLCHAHPKDEAQAALWKQLIEGKLIPPDTWEVALSAGADKKETFERLMSDGKLGALALLRNLRNMQEAKVPTARIGAALADADVRRVLPFRFIAAARYAPTLEPHLEQAMFRAVADRPKFPGRTVMLVDVSGSMEAPLSSKSQMTRMDAACSLAMILREVCEIVDIASFSDRAVPIPSRRGFALRDAIVWSQQHSGTMIGDAMASLNASPDGKYDRVIVVTDEQSHDDVPGPIKGARGYMLNVGSYQNGVGYGARWTHIDGFSESCIRYIMEVEGVGGGGSESE